MNCFSVSDFFCYFACKTTYMGRIIGIISVVLTLSVLASCTDKRAMRERLDYVSQCNRADTVFTEAWLPTVDSLVNYFDRHGNANERMMAHYLKGRVHHDMGEAPIALECYQRATEMADTMSKECDLYTLYAVYGQMSLIYDSQYLPEEEMRALKNAERIAWKDKDTINAIYTFELRKKPFYLMKDTDEILRIEHTTKKLYEEINNDSMAARTSRVVISIYLDRKQYEEAYFQMLFFEESSELFDSLHNIRRGYELYYYDKGRYLLEIGDIDSALHYFKKTMLAGKKEAAYKGLLTLYKKRYVPDSIAKYAELFAKANDSCYYHVNQERIQQITAMYDYSRQQRIAEQNKLKAEEARNERTAIIIIAIILLVLSTFFIRRTRNKAERELKRLSTEYEKTKIRMVDLIDKQRLMNYDHETKIKAKEKELRELLYLIQLTEKKNSDISENNNSLKQTYDELLQEKENIIRQHVIDMEEKKRDVIGLKEKVSLLESQLLRYSSVDMETAFKKTRIFQLFNERKTAKYIKQCPTDKDWEMFIEEFRTYFVRFYTFITIDHHLSVNQYRYCVLFRLGFDATEIGILMNKDKNQRYTLRRFIYSTLFGSPVDVEKLNEKLKQHF